MSKTNQAAKKSSSPALQKSRRIPESNRSFWLFADSENPKNSKKVNLRKNGGFRQNGRSRSNVNSKGAYRLGSSVSTGKLFKNSIISQNLSKSSKNLKKSPIKKKSILGVSDSNPSSKKAKLYPKNKKRRNSMSQIAPKRIFKKFFGKSKTESSTNKQDAKQLKGSSQHHINPVKVIYEEEEEEARPSSSESKNSQKPKKPAPRAPFEKILDDNNHHESLNQSLTPPSRPSSSNPKSTAKTASNHPKTLQKSEEELRKGLQFVRLQTQDSIIEFFGDDIQDEKKRLEMNDIYFFHRYKVNFSTSQYIEFYLYHMVGLGLLGPLMALYPLFFCFKKNRYLIHNLSFLNLSPPFVMQTVGWAIFSWMYYLFWTGSKIADFNALFMMFVKVSFRSSSIAGKYATYDPKLVQKVKNVRLTVKDHFSEFMVTGWFLQSDRTILQQIDDAMKRNEIDLPRFRLCFITNLSEEAGLAIFDIMQKQKKEGFGEMRIKKLRVQGKALDYYDGRAVLQFVIESFNKESKKSTFLTILGAILLTCPFYCLVGPFLRHRYGQTVVGVTWKEKVGFYGFSAEVFFLTASFIFFLVCGIQDMKRKRSLLAQLGQIISPKKLSKYPQKKILPTINLADRLSLRAWLDLRRVAVDYGAKYFFRHQIFLPVILLFSVLSFALGVVFLLFNLSVSADLETELKKFSIFLLMNSGYLFTFLVYLLYLAGWINEEFDKHIEILKKNAAIFYDLIEFENFYFYKVKENSPKKRAYNNDGLFFDSVSGKREECSSFIHKRLAQEVMDIVGLESRSLVKEYIESLIRANNRFVEILEDEERFNALKILGFKITTATVNNFILAFLSVIITCYEIFSA